MSAPTVLVTGATGRIGSAVVEQLLGHDVRVRALAHRRDERSDRLLAAGVDVVTADVFDPMQVRAAMDGVQRMVYVPPWHPHMMHSAVAVATAARQANLEAIVGLSQWLANPNHPSLATRQNWLTEQLFDMLPDTVHITVNPGFFADNYLAGMIGFAAQLGYLPVPAGDGRNAPPSNWDIARVVTAALLEPERHAGRRYRPTGPRLLSSADIASAVGEALGSKVRPMPLPSWMFDKALRALGPRVGVDVFLLSQVQSYYQEGKLGTWEIAAPTTDVHDATGSPAEDFLTTARRYTDGPQAQRSLANTAKALWDFTRIGLTPRPRLDRFIAMQQHPLPPTPELSAHSALWSDEHARPAHGPDRRHQPTAAPETPDRLRRRVPSEIAAVTNTSAMAPTDATARSAEPRSAALSTTAISAQDVATT